MLLVPEASRRDYAASWVVRSRKSHIVHRACCAPSDRLRFDWLRSANETFDKLGGNPVEHCGTNCTRSMLLTHLSMSPSRARTLRCPLPVGRRSSAGMIEEVIRSLTLASPTIAQNSASILARVIPHQPRRR